MTPFAELHHRAEPLVLPNAWDVPSALALAAAGWPAVGTTSFGVASSLGRPDGDRATHAANLDLAERLSGLPVLLTVDTEDGYSDDPGEVAAYVEQLADRGVVGVNLEDSLDGRLREPGVLAAKVAAVKERTPEVFVNARVDSFWFHEDDVLDPVLVRAQAYVEAGADGIFLPGLTDRGLVEAITSALPVPVNLLAIPGTPAEQLGSWGVRRISSGSLPYRAAIEAAVLAAAAVRDGTTPPPAPSYAAMQERMVAFTT